MPQKNNKLSIILQAEQDIYFLTSKRGRGNCIIGYAYNQIQAPVYLNVRIKKVVSVIEFSEREIEFIAPDELAIRLQHEPEFNNQLGCW